MGVTMKNNEFARTATERQSNLHQRAARGGHPAAIRALNNSALMNRRVAQRSLGEKLALTFILGLVAIAGVAFWLAPLALGIWALWFGITDINTVGTNGWAVAWIVVGAVLIMHFFFGGRKK